MSTGVVVFATLIVVAGAIVGTFFVARRLGKSDNEKAILEARERMDSVTSDDTPATAQRLRNSNF